MTVKRVEFVSDRMSHRSERLLV